MKKSKLLLAGALSALAFGSVQAQVQDVSVTISPLVEYTWWNKSIKLKDSPFYGARVGFGFGPFFELRGTFEKSLNIKNALEQWKGQPFNEETLKKLDGMKIDITRLGGEAKINILGGYAVSPYVTAGTGVQIFGYDPFKGISGNTVGGAIEDKLEEAKLKEKQLYVSLGGGVKFGLADRIALSLEAKYTRFNVDAINPYIDPTVKDQDKRWGNWSALASLDFYLGGNTQAESDRYGRAYRNLFTDGFRGPKFVLEPGIAYVDFKESLGRADQWFLGGSAGVDLSSLIGVRAFYYQATKNPNTLDFNFNKDLKMYGGNIIARLNYPRGIVPYLQLGAGYLDDNNFIDKAVNPEEETTGFKKKNLFALAGAGVEIPMSRYFAFYGNINSMLMSNRVIVEKTQKPSDITASLMYTAGLRVNLGMPETAPEYGRGFDNEAINSMRRGIFSQSRGCEKMTKKEFERMVNRILQKIRKEESARAENFSSKEMEVILTAVKSQNADKEQASNQELINEVRNLVQKLDNSTVVANQPATTTTIITPGAAPAQTTVIPSGQAPVQQQVAPAQRVAPQEPRVEYNNEDPRPADANYLKLNRVSAITGLNFGESTMWTVGARGYMQISNTNFDFVPELFLGVGSKNGFGLSANVLYNFNLNESPVTPYAGLGLGFFNHGLGSAFTPNFIAGVNINNVANGALFVDYSVRGKFTNNMLAVGYRFVF